MDDKYSKENKDESIHLKATKEEKAILKKAAKLQNTTVSKLILANTLPEAEKIIKESEKN